MSARTILVTGAAGFIGGSVVERATGAGDRVVGIDRSPESAVALRNMTRYVQMELPDDAFAQVLAESRPELLVHCAGRASVPHSLIDPEDDFLTNTAMTFAVLEAVRRSSPETHVVFPSSAAVYGNPKERPIGEGAEPAPISPYGFHKLQAEHLCAEYAAVHGLAVTVLRLFSAYGPGLRRQVVWDICRKALTEPALELLGTGTETRDLIHVRDIAEVMCSLTGGQPLPMMNVASGSETTIAELAAMVVDALGVDATPVFDQADTPGMPQHWQADITKLRATGFEPSVGLETGLAETAAWARSVLLD